MGCQGAGAQEKGRTLDGGVRGRAAGEGRTLNRVSGWGHRRREDTGWGCRWQCRRRREDTGWSWHFASRISHLVRISHPSGLS
jgi:hypothetical protein